MGTIKDYDQHFFYSMQENRLYQQWCQKRGLTFHLYLVIDHLCDHPDGVEISALSDGLFILRQTITGILDNLEKRGWIFRQSDLSDRRKKKVVLTELGKEVCFRIREEITEIERRAFQWLSPEEQAQFNMLYGKLVGALREEFKETED